jgi:hypothetical protein
MDWKTGRILNLILGFFCFGLMIYGEWLSERLSFCCLGLMTGELIFFLFDFRLLDCCCFGLLNLMYVIRFFPFWVFVFLV